MPETATILTLKQKIKEILNIPITHQKLLFSGRTLANEKTISSYNNTIKSGSKLTLVVKEPEPLKDLLYKIFKQYYNDGLSETLAKEFVAECELKIKQLSLDDIDRMAVQFLQRDQTYSNN